VEIERTAWKRKTAQFSSEERIIISSGGGSVSIKTKRSMGEGPRLRRGKDLLGGEGRRVS